MNERASKWKHLLNSMDETFNRQSSVSIELLLKALMEPDKRLDHWITMHTMKDEFEAYFIDNEEVFRTIGFLHMLMDHDLENLELSQSTISQLHYFIPNFKNAISMIRQASIQKELKSLMSFDDLDRLDRFISQLESKNQSLRDSELINEPISRKKVQEFRKMIAEQWRSSRILCNVLEYFGAEIITENPNEKLQWVGMHRIRFKRAKIMFVERSYQKIYNIEWGHMVNEEVTRFFLQTISASKLKQVITSETYLQAFDDILKLNSTLNIAFISLAGSYQSYRSLQESGNFTEYDDNSPSKFPFPAMGIYKDTLIIVPLRGKTMGDYVVGLKLPGSVILKRKTNDEWISKKLQVDIIEISDDNVESIIKASNPTFDSKDTAIREEAKTGVIIEIDELIDFEIPETASIVIANVKEKID